MLYRIKWLDKKALDRLPAFVYIDEGSIYDNMFSDYIRNIAANAVGGKVVQLIDYNSNSNSDFRNIPDCYKNFLEDYNESTIASLSDAYNADLVKYVEENGIYISRGIE